MAKGKPFEVNFDGLVGPTHNYAGLSFGNIASTSHRASASNPREAALQGLRKMKFLADLGIPQAVLPPHERPFLPFLRTLGFEGNDKKVLQAAWASSPDLVVACSSASSMWTANAATVSPSIDSKDRKVHFTPANLASKFHRSLEPEATGRALRAIFKSPGFVHHAPLAGGVAFGDEGAANHTRLFDKAEKPGVQLFVYGKHSFRTAPEPKRFPARQSLEASEANARNHCLSSDGVVFAQQNPEAIDAGVFHNDVAAVGHQNVFFFHEMAFLDEKRTIDELTQKFRKRTGGKLHLVRVTTAQVSMEAAVKSYLFNSQIVTLPSGTLALIAPVECAEQVSVRRYIDTLLKSGNSPIVDVHYLDLRQSMQNGGGPACLRLRVALTEAERKKSHQGVYLDDKLFARLTAWVTKNYRDRLTRDDLGDPAFLVECQSALDELTKILKLGNLYLFQR